MGGVGVGSPLAGFWMGMGEKTPHQPFPVLFDRLVWSKIRLPIPT